jgi:hypothetical protein
MNALRRRYGDHALHLIAAVATFALVGYAFIEVARNPAPLSFALFFAGAVVCHDLIAFPLYSLLDRVAGVAAGRRVPGGINFVRVPALLSGFALVVWFPLILGLDPDAYERAAGRAPADYLGRWLALTAALFVISGVVYALTARRSRRGRDRPKDPPEPRSQG